MSSTDSVRFSRIIELSNQYSELDHVRQDLHGLYVLPREKDVFTWDGIIFVSEGVWSEGIFKFTLRISPKYGFCLFQPFRSNHGSIPVLTFVTPLYHPFVNPRV